MTKGEEEQLRYCLEHARDIAKAGFKNERDAEEVLATIKSMLEKVKEILAKEEK